MTKRVALIILDGFGIGKESPFNAIGNAKMPFYQEMVKKYSHSQLITHGEAVGLPKGTMGNSEVGHMTLGAGRIIDQDLTRISKTIENRDFFRNPALLQAISQGSKQTGRVHLMGLLSNGGVHSHMDHLLALLDLCAEQRVPQVSVHVFLDGRDTPPDSAPIFLKQLLRHPTFSQVPPCTTQSTLTTLMGRYWAMDRDQRWERIEKAYRTLTGQVSITQVDPFLAIQNSYGMGKTDEFVEPLLFSPTQALQEGDSVICWNFRSDRAREITQAIMDPHFSHFNRGQGFMPSAMTTLTQYDPQFHFTQTAYAPQNPHNLFGSWLEKHQLSQFRIAETEKYAHVTFFFNGGQEKPFQKEDRTLIPSPKDVPTYDLKPEMSAFAITQEAIQRIHRKTYDFILMNFANADMIGHTGNYPAALQAIETLDTCLTQVIGCAERSGYHVILTADHGNAEEMKDTQGRIHTQHTLNPVPALWIPPHSAIAPKSSRSPLKDGTLADVMPTLCQLLGLEVPKEVTGQSLLPRNFQC